MQPAVPPEPPTLRPAAGRGAPIGLAVFRSRRMVVIALFGFSSGLPLLLTGQVMQAWLTTAQLSLKDIAAMSAVGLAYTFKFAWSPLLDRFRLPWLGRRRGWILACQLALIAAIAAMSPLDPGRELGLVCGAAIAVAMLSASQDIVLDAYQADLLAPAERAAGSSVYIIGYRVATVVSSALALVMADYFAWSVIWLTMAAMMAIGLVGTALAEEPAIAERPPRTLYEAVIRPIVDFAERFGTGMLAVLGFAAVYRFGDYFAQSLVIAFLKRGAGFDFAQIAAVYKLLGFAGIAVGSVAGGALVARFGLPRMLVGAALVSAVTHLLYVWLAAAGKSMLVFCLAVAVDNTAGALAATVLVAYFMTACSPAVSATQFALLTSLSSVGQRVFGPLADRVVDAIGWTGFFAVCAAMALPGLVLAGLAARIAERGAVSRAAAPAPPIR